MLLIISALVSSSSVSSDIIWFFLVTRACSFVSTPPLPGSTSSRSSSSNNPCHQGMSLYMVCSSLSSDTTLNKELVITSSSNSGLYMVTMVELSLTQPDTSPPHNNMYSP